MVASCEATGCPGGSQMNSRTKSHVGPGQVPCRARILKPTGELGPAAYPRPSSHLDRRPRDRRHLDAVDILDERLPGSVRRRWPGSKEADVPPEFLQTPAQPVVACASSLARQSGI